MRGFTPRRERTVEAIWFITRTLLFFRVFFVNAVQTRHQPLGVYTLTYELILRITWQGKLPFMSKVKLILLSGSCSTVSPYLMLYFIERDILIPRSFHLLASTVLHST